MESHESSTFEKKGKAQLFVEECKKHTIDAECVPSRDAMPVGTEPVQVIVSDAIDLSLYATSAQDLPPLLRVDGKVTVNQALIESLRRNKGFLNLELRGLLEISGTEDMSEADRATLYTKLLESNGVSVAAGPSEVTYS